MKTAILLFLCSFVFIPQLYSQDTNTNAEKAIRDLIAAYSHARETRDTILLNSILTDDVDQLVSSGTWRNGKKISMRGMMQSSRNNPGTRTLTIDKIRFLDAKSALVDCKYEIQNPDGSTRSMWSTFVVIDLEGSWKITAIRNMLPARAQ